MTEHLKRSNAHYRSLEKARAVPARKRAQRRR